MQARFPARSKSTANAFSIKNPADAIKQGIGFVTEDRKRFGLVLDQTILNNMTLAGLRRISGRFVTSIDAESAAGERAMKDLRVKAIRSSRLPARFLAATSRKWFWRNGY